jgi:hypothetical protein
VTQELGGLEVEAMGPQDPVLLLRPTPICGQ